MSGTGNKSPRSPRKKKDGDDDPIPLMQYEGYFEVKVEESRIRKSQGHMAAQGQGQLRTIDWKRMLVNLEGLQITLSDEEKKV